MSTLLQIRDLRLELDGPGHGLLLRDVSLDLRPATIAGLVGESGAGKTMVSRVVLGIQPSNSRITGGSVSFDGRDITHLRESERRHLLGRELAFVPQNPMTALDPVRRIEPQMSSVLSMHLGLGRTAAHERCIELLTAVQLREPETVLRRYPHELSGGMRQRILIAMAFACRPKLVIADEPTTALDVTVQKQILQLLKAMQERFRAAILFITHDLGVVAKVCDEVHVMHGGRILESAPVAELFRAPRHDYTRALLAATPRFDRPGDTLQPIPQTLTDRLLVEGRAFDDGARAP
jgi:peptide/nickel transport system ATP-binding protein